MRKNNMSELNFDNGALDWSTLEKNLNIKETKKKNFSDDRFWKLSRDENDNGGAIIRLLPDPTNTPYIQRYNHAFSSYDKVKSKKRWFLGVSPETCGLPSPATELSYALYNFGTEEAKKEAKAFSRKIKFMTNIKVIKDPANPQNEGKIFLWEFGTKLKDKFMAALNPSESEIAMGEEPKQLFNPLTGCNIKLKIAKVAGYLNYDATEIMQPSSIYKDGEEAKADILENAHKLSEFIDPANMDSYEEIKSRLLWVLECYVPEFLDDATFKKIVSDVLGTKVDSKPVQETKAVETAEPVQETKAAEPTEPTISLDEPVQEAPVKPAETKAAESDDLSFLDDL
jgi:hypothetical protein